MNAVALGRLLLGVGFLALAASGSKAEARNYKEALAQ
jgi:hypothetical protein